MQLKWIKDLLALAETRSFSRAAELRHITQSALSRRIQALETWAGMPLVDRSSHPLVLTDAGAVVCDQGQAALMSLLDMRANLQNRQGSASQILRVVAGHTLSLTCAPRLLERFRQRAPEIRTCVVAANVNDAVAMLYDGQADILVGYYHPHVPTLLDPENFQGLRLYSEALIPLSAPLPNGEPMYPVEPGNGSSVPYLAYSPRTFFGRVASVIHREAHRAPALESRYEGEMAMLLMAMAIEKQGLAWLPESLASQAMAEGRLVRAAPGWEAAMEVRVYRAAGNTTPAMESLWQWLGQQNRGG